MRNLNISNDAGYLASPGGDHGAYRPHHITMFSYLMENYAQKGPQF